MIHGMFAIDSSSSDESIDLGYIASLRRNLFRRCTDTYHYSGDVKTDVHQDDPLDMKGWSYLPDHEYDRRWVAEFRQRTPALRIQGIMLLQYMELCHPVPTILVIQQIEPFIRASFCSVRIFTSPE
jgi:hypothetical protein